MDIEIKFRAWDKKESKMIGRFNVGVGTSRVNGEYFHVMQYTGFEDRGGKSALYHKDLIVNSSRNDNLPHVIEWSEKYGGWVGVYDGLEYLIAEELNEIEKVGNIYDGEL